MKFIIEIKADEGPLAGVEAGYPLAMLLHATAVEIEQYGAGPSCVDDSAPILYEGEQVGRWTLKV